MPYCLSDKIEKLPLISSILKPLNKLGLKTINDLLYYPPYRYENLSKISRVKDLKPNGNYVIKARVLTIINQRTFGRRFVLTKALLGDDSAEIYAIWFNQPYLINNLKKNEEFLFSGKVNLGKDGLFLQNPLYEKIENFDNPPKFLSVYPLTRGLTSRWLRFLIKTVFRRGIKVEEFLPDEILKRANLMPLETTLKSIHFPLSVKESQKAKERLIFENLFLYQLKYKLEKLKLKESLAQPICLPKEWLKNFLLSLDFSLTKAQKKALLEILGDLTKNVPMNRLLNGDVGSGKTILAVIAAAATAFSNFQTAIMAPTEILAFQHFNTFRKLLKKTQLTLGLITSSGGKAIGSHATNKQEFLREISNSKIKIVIGTHALIQNTIKFSNLALVIIDEQHRFGVAQRASLLKKTAAKSLIPHFLSLTATPIPRTLALTAYGDLDISILDEMPFNRQKIITRVISPSDRPKVYNFIKGMINEGRQIFVVCPRIIGKNNGPFSNEKTPEFDFKNLEIKAVETEYENLKNIFQQAKIAKLHGRLKNQQKEKIMSEFKNKKYDILVATSLIEVGIDIANANIMIIEGAEYFGLSQLHQIRGRVGRSDHQSYCFLFTSSNDKINNGRLNALTKAKNGFELSELDLKLRGPGDFLGTRQSGEPENNFLTDSLFNLKLVEQANQEAQWLLKIDPNLKNHPKILSRLTHPKFLLHFE